MWASPIQITIIAFQDSHCAHGSTYTYEQTDWHDRRLPTFGCYKTSSVRLCLLTPVSDQTLCRSTSLPPAALTTLTKSRVLMCSHRALWQPPPTPRPRTPPASSRFHLSYLVSAQSGMWGCPSFIREQCSTSRKASRLLAIPHGCTREVLVLASDSSYRAGFLELQSWPICVPCFINMLHYLNDYGI